MEFYSPAPTVEEDFVNLVRLELNDIKRTFFKIGFRLREANNCKYYLKLGFESIEECAEALFDFRKTTTYDLMKIAGIFANNEAPMNIAPKYEKYSQSQLVLFSQINLSQKHFIEMTSPEDSIAKMKKAKNYWNMLHRGKCHSFLGWRKCKSLDEFIERIESCNPQLIKPNDIVQSEPEQLTLEENSGYPEKLSPGEPGYLLQEAKKLPKDPSFEQGLDFLSKIINEPKEKKKIEEAMIEDPKEKNENIEISEWDKTLSDHLINSCTKFLTNMSYKTIFDPDNKGMGVRVEKDLLAEQVVEIILETFNNNRTVIKTLFKNYLSKRLGQYNYEITLCGNKQGIIPFCGTVSNCIMDFFFDEYTKIKPEKKGKKKK